MSSTITIQIDPGTVEGYASLAAIPSSAAHGAQVTAVLPNNTELDLGAVPWLPPVGHLFYIGDGSSNPTSYSVVGYEPVWTPDAYTVRMILQHAE